MNIGSPNATHGNRDPYKSPATPATLYTVDLFNENDDHGFSSPVGKNSPFILRTTNTSPAPSDSSLSSSYSSSRSSHYETTHTETVSISGTATYARGIRPHIAVPLTIGTSIASMIFAPTQGLNECRAIKEEWQTTRKCHVIAEKSTAVIGFFNWFLNGLACLALGIKDIVVCSGHAISQRASSAFRVIGKIAPLFGVVAASIFMLLDIKNLTQAAIKYRSLKKELKHASESTEATINEQIAMQKKEIKHALLSLITNIALLAATIISISAVSAIFPISPYLILGLTLIAITTFVVAHKEDIAEQWREYRENKKSLLKPVILTALFVASFALTTI